MAERLDVVAIGIQNKPRVRMLAALRGTELAHERYRKGPQGLPVEVFGAREVCDADPNVIKLIYSICTFLAAHESAAISVSRLRLTNVRPATRAYKNSAAPVKPREFGSRVGAAILACRGAAACLQCVSNLSQ
jgi:hypothetical protein